MDKMRRELLRRQVTVDELRWAFRYADRAHIKGGRDLAERNALIVVEAMTGKTYREVGGVFGLTRERVRQVVYKGGRLLGVTVGIGG